MKQLLRFALAIILVVSMLTIPAYAGSHHPGVPDDEAIVVFWSENGKTWKTCGPVQRLSLSEKDLYRAIDLVTVDEDYDKINDSTTIYKMVGASGQPYAIIMLGHELTKTDYDARRCIE